MNQPLLSVNNLTHLYAPGKGFAISFDLCRLEVLGIVGSRFREDHATEINFRPPDTTARGNSLRELLRCTR